MRARPLGRRVAGWCWAAARAALAVGVAWAGLVPQALATAAEGPSEYEVKAALLFNFAKFVEWPQASYPTPEAPFVIGVLGDDPFGSALDRVLQGKTVGGRTIAIRRWRTVQEVGSCQILFISASEQGNLRRILDDLGPQPVLTVADLPEFAPLGGMVGLVVQDSRVRFEINAGRANRAHLRLSSRLLSLARIVADAQ